MGGGGLFSGGPLFLGGGVGRGDLLLEFYSNSNIPIAKLT